MNKQPTFKEQFDKITDAYFNDEILPFTETNCFVGIILNGAYKWKKARTMDWDDDKYLVYDNANFINTYIGKQSIKKQSGGLYNIYDIMKLERRFMNKIDFDEDDEIIEESIFKAVNATLDLLRSIHESKGEIIESYEFKPRTCATT